MSGSQSWCTPPEVVELVHAVIGVPDLDPFSNAGSKTGAAVQWHGPDAGSLCGFSSSWREAAGEGGAVFFNPPWSRAGDAIRKAAREAKADPTMQMIGLVPSSINSRHWDLIEDAPCRAYPHRRVSFVDPETGEVVKGNPRDIALVYWGPRPYRFADVLHRSRFARVHFGIVGAA